MMKFGRMVVFRNKIENLNKTLSEIEEYVCLFQINIVIDCVASLLQQKNCSHVSFSHPSHFKQILFPELRSVEIFCIWFEFIAALQLLLLLLHSASQLWFPPHLLRRTLLGGWARGHGGALTFVHQGGVCCDTILK